MNQDLKKEYITILKQRYQNADRRLKSQIIAEAQSNLGYHRKAVIRLLNRPIFDFKLRGRKLVYTKEVVELLSEVWKLMGYPCSQKLKSGLPTWLRFIATNDELKRQVCQMSPATMDRRLKKARAQVGRSKRSGTKPGSLLKNSISIKPLDHQVRELGMVEADTVAHCGDSLSGQFIWSLTITDVLSGWTENRAMWGKGSAGVIKAFQDIERKLPFKLKKINVDNGSEFLNNYFINYLAKSDKSLSRSRPYKKNDNCHVEQKNWSHVRSLFGYERLDGEKMVNLMNEIYCIHSELQNFFIPQMRLEYKIRKGAKYYRKYTKAQTPYQMIEQHEGTPMEIKLKLRQMMEQLNPVMLRQKINLKLKEFSKELSMINDNVRKVA